MRSVIRYHNSHAFEKDPVQRRPRDAGVTRAAHRCHHRQTDMNRVLLQIALIHCLGGGVCLGQLLYSAPAGGGASSLIQQSAGASTVISTGLSDNVFPSISRDGRLVVVSGPDPLQPAQASTDLWLIDRVVQTRTRIVNHTSTNLPGGAVVTVNPQWSGLAPGNAAVVVTDQIVVTGPGAGVTPQLNIYRVSDGFPLSLVEIGQGNALDLMRSEFVGIGWKPDGSGFATPAYANYVAQSGATRPLVGILFYSYNPALGTATRSAVLSAPRYYDLMSGLPSETHILPVFSPDGTRLAYFEIFWPNAVLTQQATATLMTANANGSAVVSLLQFPTGQFPMGLCWSSDGSQLIYSRAPQVFSGGTYLAAGDPASAVIRSVDSVAGGTPTTLAGVDAGYFPNFPAVRPLAQTSISLTLDGARNQILRAAGLPGSALFGVQSTTTLTNFGARQNFTGAQLASGIDVTTTNRFRAFRLVE